MAAEEELDRKEEKREGGNCKVGTPCGKLYLNSQHWIFCLNILYRPLFSGMSQRLTTHRDQGQRVYLCMTVRKRIYNEANASVICHETHAHKNLG